MSKTFRDALIDITERTGISLASVCEKAGVSYEQIKKLKQRPDAKTNVDDALKIAAALGLTLNELVEDDLAEDRALIVATYFRLSDQERRLLQATGRGLSAHDPAEDPQ